MIGNGYNFWRDRSLRRLRVAMVTASVLMAFIGLSVAVDSTYLDVYPKGIQIEESTQGNGFHSSYLTSKMGKLSMMNYAHGSGSLDSDVTIAAYEYKKLYHPVGVDWVDENTEFIQFKEDNSVVYAPVRTAIGTGYYAIKPVDYNSWSCICFTENRDSLP